MEKKLLALLEQSTNVQATANSYRAGKACYLSGLAGQVKPAYLCALKESLQASWPLVIMTARREDSKEFRRVLNYFYEDLPSLELYPTDLRSREVETKSRESQAEKMAALEMLLKHQMGVVFVTAETFLQKLPPVSSFQNNSLRLKVGEELTQGHFIEELVRRGYERVEQVETLGQFTVRGEILDVFPINMTAPLRLEWFDQTLDALRTFEPLSQRALSNLEEAEIAALAWENTEEQVSLFAYLQKQLIALDEPVGFFATLEKLAKESQEYAQELFTVEELQQLCNQQQLVTLSALPQSLLTQGEQQAVAVRRIAPYNKNTALLLKDLAGYLAEGLTPLVLVGSKEKAVGITESLQQAQLEVACRLPHSELEQGKVNVFVGELTEGFRFWEEQWLLITEGDIFGMQKKRRLPKHRSAGAPIQFFSEIKAGDYVVHDVHGIGRYEGVKTILVDGVHRDYLHLIYAGEDKLYLPVEQVSLLHKYVGNEGKIPRLSKMGGSDWQRITTKAKKAITEMATELLRLYAQRKITGGYAFAPDNELQQEFEDSFPFEETPDQLKALREIKADMEKPIPMDRLLCGDVGYGKTEVAIRAAFKAVLEGKQVAVLAPTTVLAQQHLMTFKQRMEHFGVQVEMVSRFRSTKQKKEILERLGEGRIDVLIGTHSLLQPYVQFADLGLLIVDEEQRFGVAQKEKIKQWTVGIDVLTLSATPIPRTLHLALVNGKDMSVIESPPEDRLPVETYVAEYNESMLKEALERELRRGGRIYYIHNRIEGLVKLAEQIRSMVPGINVKIAHGRMPEELLEDAMVGFYEGTYDVLLCTSIVENGLDVPLANTIIVDGAENFGLSQLYQMRGRVGRSSRLAYAYFVYKKNKVLSEIAQKRLQAIRDFTELGAGFQIAMRDLEIRGAGNILGAQQHGHIAGIGFAAYCALLESTIMSLKNGTTGEPVEPDPVLEIKLDAYIPEDYISDPRYKMELYRRCSELDYRDRADLLDEIIDRFGTPPTEVVNLWRLASLRSLCRILKIVGITVRQNEIRITFHPQSLCNGEKLVELVEEYAPAIKFRTSAAQPQMIIDTHRFKLDALTWLEKNVIRLADRSVEANG